MFSDVVDNLINFIDGAVLVFYNAALTIEVLVDELERLDHIIELKEPCELTDILDLAELKHYGNKTYIDDLLKKYNNDPDILIDAYPSPRQTINNARMLVHVYWALINE